MEKPVQKDDPLQLDKYEHPDTSLTTLKTKAAWEMVSIRASWLCSPHQLRAWWGGQREEYIFVCLFSPWAAIQDQQKECQWWWRFVWCGVLSLLLQNCLCFPYSLVFLEIPRVFLKILQEGNQKHSINQQHSSRSAFCCLVATHIASAPNGSWLLRLCFSACLKVLSYVVSWPPWSLGTDEQNQLNTEFSADRSTNAPVWHCT